MVGEAPARFVVLVDGDHGTRERTQVLDEGRCYIKRSEEQCVDRVSEAFAGVRPVRNRLTTSIDTDDLLGLNAVPQVSPEHGQGFSLGVVEELSSKGRLNTKERVTWNASSLTCHSQ